MRPNLKRLVTIDFETYFDDKYSLRNRDYNTSEYIRDPKFKVHCIGIKVGTKKARWYKEAEGRAILEGIDWATHSVLAHNTAFDGFILKYHYGIVPQFYYDTLSMTRGLHAEVSRASLETIAKFYGVGEKSKTYLTPTKGLRDLPPDIMRGLGEGCQLDVELCYDVFRTQVAVYPEDELRLIDMTMRMFCDPVLEVDVPRATRELGNELIRRDLLIEASGATEAELSSNAKFAELLRNCGVQPPTKISLRTGQENYAFAKTDPEFIELLEHEDIRVVRLAEARLAAKSTIGETRATRFINAGNNGKLPVGLNYYGAKTGRWSGGNSMNLQNLPRGGELRRSILAPRGHVVVVADSAQIEARVNAWLAGEEAVVDAFRRKVDIYSSFASRVYGFEVNKEEFPDERFVGKVGILGLGYQMGWRKFQTTLALGTMGPPVFLSDQMCQKIVTTYRAEHAHIRAQWNALQNIVLYGLWTKKTSTYKDLLDWEDNCVWLPNGMSLQYPGLTATIDAANDRVAEYKYSSHGVWKKIYGGLLTENIVQALARIIIGEQMLQIADNYRVVTMTHDEIVCVAPKKKADECFDYMHKVMCTPPEWCSDLPLDAEGGYDYCYSK